MGSRYAAFISYSHTADLRLATLVQRALQRLGKRWYRRPTLRVFRDETGLSANPGLWTSIEGNLAQSDYFVLVASPSAAASLWVAKEVQWWRDHREAKTLLIVVTEGKIAWDARAGDFDWRETTCLPLALQGFEREEPLYVDLRWAKRRGLPRFRDPRFREAILMLLAAITGRAKDEIDSEDIRQQRGLKFTAIAAALVIVVLAVGAVYGAWIATKNRVEAENNYRKSESRRLAAASLAAMDQNDGVDRAITLGVLAWRIARTPEAEAALQKLQSTTSDVARILGQHTAEIKHLAFSGDSSVLATAAEDGSIALWRVADWRPTGTVLPAEPDVTGVALDWTGTHVLALELVSTSDEDRYEHKAVLWDVKSKTHQVLMNNLSSYGIDDNAALSPDGKLVAFRKDSWRGLVLWDANVQNWSKQIVVPRVETFRFIDNSNLIFLSYSGGYDDGAKRNSNNTPIEGIRVGQWNITTGAVKFGAFADNLEIGDIVDYGEQTFSGDGSKLYWPNRDKPIWAVQRDLTLSPLRGPDRRPGQTVFDHKGERALIGNRSTRPLVWDLGRNQVLKVLGEEPGHGGSQLGHNVHVGQSGFTATLSPDGRWLAAVNGSRDAPVVVWDLSRPAVADPTSTLQAVCNIEESLCIRRLCEKISAAIDEAHLRELVGDNAFAEFRDTIRTPQCGL